MACDFAIGNQNEFAGLDPSLAGLDPSLAKRPNYGALVDQKLFICGGIMKQIIEKLKVGIEISDVLGVPVTRQNYYELPLCDHKGVAFTYKSVSMSHVLRVLHADKHFLSIIHKAAIYVWQIGNYQVEIIFVFKDDKDTKVVSLSKPLNELNCKQIACNCRDNCKKT
jgi:hypothetical protein